MVIFTLTEIETSPSLLPPYDIHYSWRGRAVGAVGVSVSVYAVVTTTIRFPFSCNSTALRPCDDLRRNRRPAYLCVRAAALRTEQAVGGRPPRYAPAQACNGDIYVMYIRIWIGHHYCMSMLACQYNQPKRPCDLDL